MKYIIEYDTNKEEFLQATLHHQGEFSQQLEALIRSYRGEDSIIGYGEDDMRFLRFSEMDCITVVNAKTYAILSNGEQYRLRLRLYEAAELLPPSFFRLNKSTFANRSKIQKYEATFSGSVNAVFKSGYVEYVSRRCFAEIKRELKKK